MEAIAMMQGKVALVTGAAQGIGKSTALALANYAANVVLCDLQSTAELADRLGEKGVKVLELRGDISDEEVVKGFVEQVQQEFGTLDILVNNAGISFISPTTETSTANFRRVLDVNLLGPFLLCREFGKIMLAKGSGSIINIASIAGLFGISERSAYNASKHGLIGLTHTLAAEWGGYGVRCNAVCPGWVKTEMDAADQGSGNYTDADIVNRVPMGRFARPEDIAQLVCFLADSEKSGFINGQAIAADGGWTADASWESLRLKYRPQ
jgi:NAD(P)-dependent dehydrogenase (short-subunit alcohol dehydrogenase family)